jgi:dTDP-4-dehydrorhamnose reductase
MFARKITLIGADGQLGSDLLRTLRDERLTPLYYPDFDITRPAETRSVLSGIRPDVVSVASLHQNDKLMFLE